MSDTPNVESTDEDPKGMRAIISEQAAELRQLKGEKKDAILSDLGLSADKGLGLALSESFERGDVTLDNLASTATEKYGHVVPDAAAAPSHPQAAQVQEQQARLDQVGATAGAIPVAPTDEQRLLEAEQNRDNAQTMAMKGQEVAAWFGRPPGT